MGHIVLVRGDAVNGTAGDLVLQARLEAAGHTVERVADDDPEFGGAYDGVVISDSCSGNAVGSKYDTVAKPGITCENVQWRLGTYLSGITGTNWTVQDVAGNAGLTGDQVIYSEPVSQQAVDTDTLPAAATVVARLTGDADHGAYVTYEAGGALTSGTAPARRVFLRLGDAAVPVLTAAGTALLDAAIAYAFGPAMETVRFYLTSSPTPAPPGSVTAFWHEYAAATAEPRVLGTAPSGAPDSTAVAAPATQTSWFGLLGQFVSPPASAAGTVGHTFGVGVAFSEDDAAADLYAVVHLRILDAAVFSRIHSVADEFGTTPQGIEYTDDNPSGSPVDFEAADRFILEVGFRSNNTDAIPRTGTLYLGGTGAPDMAGGVTDLSRPGWIDLQVTSGVTFVEPIVTGSAAVDLGAASVVATGRRIVSGTATLPLGALSVTASGTVVPEVVTGTATVDLGALSAAAHGVRTVSGTAGLPLGALELTATGEELAEVVHGAAEFVLGGVEVTATGVRIVTGTAAVNGGPLELDAVGDSGEVVVTGTAAVDLGALAVAASGRGMPSWIMGGQPRPVRGLTAGTIVQW